MSDDQGFDPEDFEGISEKMATVPRRQVRQWEQDAKALREATAKLAQFERERNFVKAGIPDTPMGKLFMRGYEGADEADAIKAAALEYGILKTEAGQDDLNRSLDGHDAARAAASGAATPDPRVDLDARMRAAKNPRELAQILEEAGIKPSDLQGFPELRRP